MSGRRSSATKSAISTPLRRSPRLLQLNNRSLQPEEVKPNPKLRSGNNPSFTTSLCRPLVSNCQKTQPNDLQKVEVKNGGSSTNFPRSIRKTPSSSSKVEKILGLRRSPRFVNRENSDGKTCRDESNMSTDCRKLKSTSRVGGIQGLRRSSRFCNRKSSHGTSNHEIRRSLNEGVVKETDHLEMDSILSIAADPPAKGGKTAEKEKEIGHVQRAVGRSSNRLKSRGNKKSQANTPEAPNEVLRETEADYGKQVRGDSSKHPEGRLPRMTRRQTLAAKSGGGQVKMECGDGKENKGGNVITLSDVEAGRCGKKGHLSEKCEVIGVKRKRKQVEAVVEIELEWTKEQETALQRAYFTAKPTPQFWKNVARQVPGKSAQDCFDKVHSYDPTPLPRDRSRVKARNTSPLSRLSFSASKLLIPSEAYNKKSCMKKQKSHVLHRNARHMLQKNYQVDKDNEPDLFSFLEPTVDISAPFTPERFVGQLGSPSPVSSRRSSSGKNECLSRFSTISGTALTTPAVLKQVKNVALHEKYIDKLHVREAKRKAASKLNGKSVAIEESVNGMPVQNKDVIRAARDALVTEACNAISKLKDLQRTDDMDELSDGEECFNEEDFEDVEVDAL